MSLPTAMELFRMSLPERARILIVGASDAEVDAMAQPFYEVTGYDYAHDGVRWEDWQRKPDTYDAIYCAHTLEHVRNVGVMLDAMYEELVPGGLLCIVVPPAKHNIVGGHLTIWNAGLLLYNLIRARFDCSKAAVRSYDYNVAVIVRKVRADFTLSSLREDNGDLHTLAAYFPVPMPQDHDGRIALHDWGVR